MKLPIVRYGDPILRAKGKRIAAVDAHVRELAANMIETMHLANGIGLAAQQVGEALQLTVIDVSGAEDQESTMKLNGAEVDPKSSMPLLLLNPELSLAKETDLAVEGCLSFPGNHGGYQTLDFRGRARADARRRAGGNRSERVARARASARGRSPQRDSLHRPDERRDQGGLAQPVETNAKGKRGVVVGSVGTARWDKTMSSPGVGPLQMKL